jgi:predicted dehydrogenase
MTQANKIWGVAVVGGSGSIGGVHVRALKDIDRVRVVGLSSLREDRGQDIAMEHGCVFTTDPMALIRRDDVDLVSIATSSGSHAELALAAIAAGKHVVVEKPMAMTTEDARRVLDAARRQGVVVSVISQRRFEAIHQAVKRLLDEQALGKLLLLEAFCPYLRSQAYYDQAQWRGTVTEDGGALMNQAIHSVDLLLWFGGPAREVYGRCVTQTHSMEAEDLAVATITFASGALGTIMASTSIQPGFQATINLYGDKGTIKLEGASLAHFSVPGVTAPSDGEAQASTGVASPKLASHEHHRQQFADVIAAMETGRPPAVTGEDGLRAVELVCGVYRASATGRPVALAG